MGGIKKDIDPASELVEEDDDATLPESELESAQDAAEEPAQTAGTLAAGLAAIGRYARHAPKAPGVYRMIDAKGDVLYVGKAKSIRKRIASYTRPTGHDSRITRMIAATATLEFVTTATETEALLLEANLIKRLRPRFNVLLRDDKSFPYILITSDHWAPQILKHRGARTRQGHYYGPFASAVAVNRTINTLERAFLLRSVHARDRVRRLFRACARGQFLSLRPLELGAKAPRRRNGQSLERAGFRARGDVPRPALGAVRDPGTPGYQSAQRRGSRRVRRASGRRLYLRRGVFLSHRAELGQPRILPQSRSRAGARRRARRLSRAVLRRQAAAAPHSRFARFRGARAAGGRAVDQSHAQNRRQRAAAWRAQGAGAARAGQRARSIGAQARRYLLAAEAATRLDRDFFIAARAAPHRGLRQQPYFRQQRGRRHDRRRLRRLPQKPVPQVQHPLGRAFARRRLRHDARGLAAPLQAADGGSAASERGGGACRRVDRRCGRRRGPAVARFGADRWRAGAVDRGAGDVVF